MGRPKGTKNRRTLLREAEQYVGSKHVDQVLDSLYRDREGDAALLFAGRDRQGSRPLKAGDEDYKQAAMLAALAAPYRHARLSAMKLAGHPNNPARFKDDATADELRAEVMRRLMVLQEAGAIDLKLCQCQRVQ